jgi:hypothetical protein
VLLWACRHSRAIVVIGGVDVVSRLQVVLRLPRIPRFVLGYAAVVTTVGPFVLPHVQIQCRAFGQNRLLWPGGDCCPKRV